jgi:hypothetical protein
MICLQKKKATAPFDIKSWQCNSPSQGLMDPPGTLTTVSLFFIGGADVDRAGIDRVDINGSGQLIRNLIRADVNG